MKVSWRKGFSGRSLPDRLALLGPLLLQHRALHLQVYLLPVADHQAPLDPALTLQHLPSTKHDNKLEI